MYTRNTLVTKIEDIPKKEHFAVLEFTTSTHYTPGDERSRTNPGHGYPESWDTVTNCNYMVFDSEADLISWIELANKYPNSTFVVLSAKPVKVSTKIEIKIDK